MVVFKKPAICRKGQQGAIRDANQRAYACTGRDAYMREDYHRVRIEEGIGLLVGGAGILRGVAPEARVRILDLGAGGDAVTALLSLKGLRPFVSDIEFGVGTCLRRSGTASVIADALASPFETSSFDAMFMGELIEHIFDTISLLEECHRILRPEGILVVTTPNLASAQDRMRFLFGLSPRQVDPFHPFRRLHIRPFTLSGLQHVLGKCGFRVDEVTSNYIEWKFRGRTFRWRRLAKVFPSVGGSLIVRARTVKS